MLQYPYNQKQHLRKGDYPMRYAESYTRFLKYCETQLNQPFENLILEFQHNKIEDEFLKIYQFDQASSSEAYFERLEVETYNIQGKNKKENTGEDTLWLRLCIMIELLMEILNCRYSKAYSIIIQSETYYWLVQEDFATMYDSPQANLDDIGRELRETGGCTWF